MAITRAAGFPTTTNTSSTSLTPSWVTVGDLAVVTVAQFNNQTDVITGITGTKTTGWQVVKSESDSTDNGTLQMWAATITATGSDSITVTWSSSPASAFEAVVEEFTAGLGSSTVWTLVASGGPNRNTSNLFASATSGSVTLQMYYGYGNLDVGDVPGTTSGFTYTASGIFDNCLVFNGALAVTTAYQPNATNNAGGTLWSAVGIFSAQLPAAVGMPPQSLVAPIILRQYGLDGVFRQSPQTNVAINVTATPTVAGVTVAGLDANNPALTVFPTNAPASVAGLDVTVNVQNPVPISTQIPVQFILAQYGLVYPQPLTQLSSSVTVTAGVAAATVAANNPVVAVTGLPGAAAVTVAALQNTPLVSPALSAAAVTVGASNPLPLVTVGPSVANVTVAALQPSVTAGGNITAAAGVAAVTVAANNPTPAIVGFPSAANLVVAALNAGPSVLALPSASNVTVGANNPATAVVAFPSQAAVVVAAFNPSVSVGGNVTVNAGLAAVTVAAIGPASNVSPVLAVAAVVIAALAAKPLVTVIPTTANLVTAVFAPTINGVGDVIGTASGGDRPQSTAYGGDSAQASTAGGDS